MVNKVELDTISSLVNQTQALSKINGNFDKIEVGFQNTLSRDGSAPNTMESVIDMNSNRIINLPAPVNSTDAARKQDLDDTVLNVTGIKDEVVILAQNASSSALSASNSAGAAASSANAALTSETNASASAGSAGSSAILANKWATQLITPVESTEYSSKENAVGDNVTTGSSKNWATQVGTTIGASLEYSSKEYAVGTVVPSGSSKSWANTTGTAVDGVEFSAKEYASGSVVSTGSSKDWASKTSSTVDGSEYSAKYYANQAAISVNGFNNFLADTGEPTGFVLGGDSTPPTDSELLYDYSTRTFTIQPKAPATSFVVNCGTNRYVKSAAETIVHDVSSGIYLVYYNSSGVLTVTQVLPTSWRDIAFVSFITYRPTATDTIKGYITDERHGCTLDWATHQRLHFVDGAKFSSGFPLSGYTLQPSSPVTSDNQFTVGSGIFFDEDLKHVLSQLVGGTQYTVSWLVGDGSSRDYLTTNTTPYTIATNYLHYNQNNAGTWQRTEVTAGNFVNYFLVAINTATGTDNQKFRFVLSMGQNQFASLATAQANETWDTHVKGSLLTQEIIPLYQITFRTNNSYTSSGKCRVEGVLDLRGFKGISGGASTVSSHNSLSGRSDAGSHPSSAITYDNTTSGLAATNVQTAIDEVVAAGSGLPSPVANTMLVRNAGNTAYETKTAAQVLTFIGAVDSVTAGDSTITVGGTSENPTIVVNTANIAKANLSNATAGSVTTTLLNDSIVHNLTSVTPATGDYVMLADTSDSNKKKKALVSDLVNLGGGVFSKSYASSAQTFAANGTYTLSHGLGVEPKIVYVYGICNTANAGYSVGDKLVFSAFGMPTGNYDLNACFIFNSSSIVIVTGEDGLAVMNKSTHQMNVVSIGNWQFYIQAYA